MELGDLWSTNTSRRCPNVQTVWYLLKLFAAPTFWSHTITEIIHFTTLRQALTPYSRQKIHINMNNWTNIQIQRKKWCELNLCNWCLKLIFAPVLPFFCSKITSKENFKVKSKKNPFQMFKWVSLALANRPRLALCSGISKIGEKWHIGYRTDVSFFR